jgi:hypothetical protein
MHFPGLKMIAPTFNSEGNHGRVGKTQTQLYQEGEKLFFHNHFSGRPPKFLRYFSVLPDRLNKLHPAIHHKLLV